MKSKFILKVMLISILTTSCVTPIYYQVYKTIPSGNVSLKEDFLVYEDENCKVLYNFWSENGNVGFVFFNKTENTLYLNLVDSYFVLNGVAHDYFQNRTFTNTKKTGIIGSRTIVGSKSISGLNNNNLLQTSGLVASTTSGETASEEYSISYKELEVIAVPSKTSKSITEFYINSILYRDCDLFKYPTKRNIKTKTFTRITSPIVFSNRLIYYSEIDHKPVYFENEFFVSEITNYAEPDITRKDYERFCNEKSSTTRLLFKDVSPDKFYIKYTKSADSWSH